MGLWANLGCDQYSERTGALDFDGNGLDDWYCVGVNGNEQFYVFPSTGQSFIWPAFGSLDGTFCPHEYYVFGDVNADGRADATCAINGQVALSTGREFVISSSPFGGFCASWDPNIFAADVDGDGASEIVCNDNMEGSPSVSDILVRKWTGSSLGPAENWKDNWCTGSVSGGDFNGDGKTDLYCGTAATPVAVAGTGGLQADLISSIANGLGGTIHVGYTPSSVFPNINNPSTKHVVTSVTRLDGRGGSSTSTYSYLDSLMDRKERKFLGFRHMKETLPCIAGESSCPTVETWLKQDLASVGKLERIDRNDGAGGLLRSDQFDYATNGSTVPRTSLLAWEVAYVFDVPSQCGAWPCSTGRRITTNHQYDAYGNRTRMVQYGDYDVAGDETTTDWAFRANTAAYIVDRVAVEQRFAGTTGPGGALLAEKVLYYDGADADQPPIKGAVTKAFRWLNTENRHIPRRFGYDQWGNVTSVIDETDRPTTITYDAVYHVYPTSVTNGADEVSTTVWDPVCSVPIEVNGPNQVAATRTTMQYDSLCRPTRTDTPTGGFREWAYVAFGNPAFSYPGAQRVIEYSPSGSADWDSSGAHYAANYFDGFGRTYRTVAKGPAPELDILQDATYNARGGVAFQTAPYFPPVGPQTTSYAYDPFDRVVRVTFPDAEEITKSYGLLNETTNDEHGHPATARFDVFGRQVAREQTFGGQVLQTSSEYDLLGRLVGMTDAEGNAWSWTYDSLGRNTVKTDPDAGTWTYSYDDADRPRLQVDAKSQHTEFTYDTAGRLASKKTRETESSPAATTTFVRSEAGPGFYNSGQVTSLSSVSPTNTPIDSIQIDYDARGQVVNERREFDGQTFVSERRYDSGGRLRGITYPDGDSVGPAGNPLRYDAAGRLTLVPGIIDYVYYDASGRPTRRRNTNGTETTWTYSPGREFLTGITTTLLGGTPGGIQNLAYVPDAAGMLTQVTSGSTFGNESWTYTYDELHRLTLASSANPIDSTQQFGYDGIGRITFNSHVGNYTYPLLGLPRPHAPTVAGPNGYSYDDNGNLVAKTGGNDRTVQWNVDNLPIQINGVQFTYGATGDRIKKASATGTSLYPLGDDYEVTNGVTTKYISLPDVGLVAKRRNSETFWLHTDRLGSIQAITDLYGAVMQRRTYRPYGDKIADMTAHVESRGFIDQRQDEETGLTYLHARYYDPALGVFLSADPIGAAGGLNGYSYSFGDPVNLSDPSGLLPPICAIAHPATGECAAYDYGSVFPISVRWYDIPQYYGDYRPPSTDPNNPNRDPFGEGGEPSDPSRGGGGPSGGGGNGGNNGNGDNGSGNNGSGEGGETNGGTNRPKRPGGVVVQVGALAEAGLVAVGFGGQVGGGTFITRDCVGGFVEGGVYGGPMVGGAGVPASDRGIVGGTAASAGVMVSVTNAADGEDLRGNFDSLSVTTPYFSAQYQVGTNAQGRTIRVGGVGTPGVGFSFSWYRTNTPLVSGVCR